MLQLASHIAGEWVKGTGKLSTLRNPSTEEPVAETGTEGIDFKAALAFARDTGGPALRGMTFVERGALLRSMARAIHELRDELIQLAMENGGNTRGDAKFDIDGASGTLAAYADLAQELGDKRWMLDGDAEQLGRSPRFVGQHIIVPRRGVAVHINAFNFPAWGLAEKAACALLAGMPVVSKPATSTAVVSHRIVQAFVEADLLPKGALSFVCGRPGDMLDHLEGDDVLAFTGGGSTAATLRALAPVVKKNVRVNVEADSLNAAILGPDAEQGSDAYNMFLRDVVRDITQKTGQKCTAIRRVYVPKDMLETVEEDLVDRLKEFVVGNTATDGVTMGPVSTKTQQDDVLAGIARLAEESRCALGKNPIAYKGVSDGKGYFVPPTLFIQDDPSKAKAVDEHEVFGPVATVLPFDNASTAGMMVRRGGGGLVSSIYSDDRKFAGEMLMEIASAHGRVMLGSAKVADHAPGPGTVLPQMIHGGPGRAGGGEELGGVRGLSFYSQRTAVQGSRPMLEAILTK